MPRTFEPFLDTRTIWLLFRELRSINESKVQQMQHTLCAYALAKLGQVPLVVAWHLGSVSRSLRTTPIHTALSGAFVLSGVSLETIELMTLFQTL